jgi:hypothetical protein
VDLDALLDMSTDDLVQLFPARARRRWVLDAAGIGALVLRIECLIIVLTPF